MVFWYLNAFLIQISFFNEIPAAGAATEAV
jgi:hypothetical protein